MTRVKVEDERVLEALDAVSQPVEICDANGRVLGCFLPKVAGTWVFRRVQSPLSPEERERLIREEGPKARPLSEFWEELKRKYPDAHDQSFWDELQRPYPEVLK